MAYSIRTNINVFLGFGIFNKNKHQCVLGFLGENGTLNSYSSVEHFNYHNILFY